MFMQPIWIVEYRLARGSTLLNLRSFLWRRVAHSLPAKLRRLAVTPLSNSSSMRFAFRTVAQVCRVAGIWSLAPSILPHISLSGQVFSGMVQPAQSSALDGHHHGCICHESLTWGQKGRTKGRLILCPVCPTSQYIFSGCFRSRRLAT